MCYKIAIVGATGLVGREVLKILAERHLDNNEILLYASEKSMGTELKVGNKICCVRQLDHSIIDAKLDFALFCVKENVSKEYVTKLSQNRVKVIDFSSYFRKKKPLVVPEINSQDIRGNIICNPNCSTIGAVMALYEIHKRFGLERIVYSTYQAVSGAGKDAVDDLNFKRDKPMKFEYPIYNNLIPYIGKLDSKGYSIEENKMMYETSKILHERYIKISATCVRVPLEVCHGESINFQTTKHCTVGQIKEILKMTKGVKLVNDFLYCPMPVDVQGQDLVFVGRVRKDHSQENTFNIFVVSDNLRKGAAQNGVQILEELIKRKDKNCKN
ncbi:MAG: aspartate-semialdehyde dehydrogenase [Clostridia bacterium]|nr:aspartate-semialdehyde dehydrogenase [Clostridia bacterium]